MLITFHCEHCGAKLRINADAMGEQLDCPECGDLLTVPDMQLGPGFVVGGFLIKHKVGQGGMGEVYLATQLSLERDVALKILPSRYTAEKSFLVRFLKEVHYQAKMDHPNIVTAYDAGEDNGVYFMAMAYVAGETLEEVLNREGVLAEADALQVVRQVALALQYASDQKGILHRDIKPANIMVTPSLHAKVLDMGLSKNTLEKKSTTLADTILGTPNYMSPEQIDHPQDIDTRSDMFSLGTTLYHMLTGQVPYEDSSYLKTLNRHARDKLEDPRDLMPGISPGAARLLARLLARDPAHRYDSWDALLVDLQRVQSRAGRPALPEGETSIDLREDTSPLSANRTPSGFARRSPESRRRPFGVFFSVVIGLLLGLGGIYLMWIVLPGMTHRLPSAQPTPPPERTPAPSSESTPGSDSEALRRQLAAAILFYERNPHRYDRTLEMLLDLGTRGAGTPVAESAAEQIVRVRRDRDEAVEEARRRLRESTLRILYEEGADRAREHLEASTGPFQDETGRQREKLRHRIRIWEQQERSQRLAEERAAQERFLQLLNELVPLVLQRDWSEAIRRVDRAAEDPALFAASAEVASLRRELLALRAVPDVVRESYRSKLNREILLKLRDEVVSVRIRELRPDGLLISRIVFGDDGSPQGSVGRFIPFSELSAGELLDQLQSREGSEFDIYRALIAHQADNPKACRGFLSKAGTPLARAVERALYEPMDLSKPTPQPTASVPFPINTPRFAIPPTPASPSPATPTPPANVAPPQTPRTAPSTGD